MTGTSSDTARIAARVLFVGQDHETCCEAQKVLTRAGILADATSHATSLFRLYLDEAPPYDVVIVDFAPDELPIDEIARRMRARHPEIAMAVVATSFDARRSPYDAWVERPCRPSSLVEVVRTASIARERRCGRTTAS